MKRDKHTARLQTDVMVELLKTGYIVVVYPDDSKEAFLPSQIDKDKIRKQGGVAYQMVQEPTGDVDYTGNPITRNTKNITFEILDRQLKLL